MAAAPPPVLPTTPTALRDRPPPAYMLGAGAVQIHLLGANELQAKNAGSKRPGSNACVALSMGDNKAHAFKSRVVPDSLAPTYDESYA